MDETAMGLVDTAFLIAYAVGQFIWGALGRNNSIGAAKQPIGTHDATRPGQVSL